MSTIANANEKIFQAVYYGSVYEALEARSFSHADLLKWLATAKFEERTQVAYKAVTDVIHPNQQYMEDGMHFLASAPRFFTMATALGMEAHTPVKMGAPPIKNNTIIVALRDTLAQGYNNKATLDLMRLIISGSGNDNYVQSHIATCYRARTFPHTRMSPTDVNRALLESDWTKKLRYNVELPGLILARVAGLQKSAPIYYAEIAYKLYHGVVAKLHKDKLLSNLSREQLVTFNTFFPNVIDPRILAYSEGAYLIALLGNDVAGYVLGFPIHEFIPDEDQINTALTQLTQMGREPYAQHISAYALKLQVPLTPFPFPDATFKNEEDVMMEEITHYSPFDVVSFRSGNHIFRFTRCEFAQMVEKKKNPWTNEWLPPSVLATVQARHSIAKELGLPPCRTVLEMLERAEGGKLFQPDEETQQAQVNPLPQGDVYAAFGQAYMPWIPRAPSPRAPSPSVVNRPPQMRSFAGSGSLDQIMGNVANGDFMAAIQQIMGEVNQAEQADQAPAEDDVPDLEEDEESEESESEEDGEDEESEESDSEESEEDGESEESDSEEGEAFDVNAALRRMSQFGQEYLNSPSSDITPEAFMGGLMQSILQARHDAVQAQGRAIRRAAHEALSAGADLEPAASTPATQLADQISSRREQALRISANSVAGFTGSYLPDAIFDSDDSVIVGTVQPATGAFVERWAQEQHNIQAANRNGSVFARTQGHAQLPSPDPSPSPQSAATHILAEAEAARRSRTRVDPDVPRTVTQSRAGDEEPGEQPILPLLERVDSFQLLDFQSLYPSFTSSDSHIPPEDDHIGDVD